MDRWMDGYMLIDRCNDGYIYSWMSGYNTLIIIILLPRGCWCPCVFPNSSIHDSTPASTNSETNINIFLITYSITDVYTIEHLCAISTGLFNSILKHVIHISLIIQTNDLGVFVGYFVVLVIMMTC